jgi:hypothetical protein
MRTVQQVIYAASVQLADQRPRQEYTRWTQAMLVQYLNDAMAEISSIRPEAFALRQWVTLVPGYIQTVPDGTMAFVKIEQNPDGTMAYEGDTELLKAMGTTPPKLVRLKYDADGNVVFNVRSYSIDSTDPKTYYISPPVPLGVTVQVQASFVNNPWVYSVQNLSETVDVAPGIFNLAQDYMLGRAYEIDSESAESKSNSVKHFQQFYQFFGLNYKQTSAFQSSNYGGNTAAGNAAITGAR